MAVSVTSAKFGVFILGILGFVLLIIGIAVLSVLPIDLKENIQENSVLEEFNETFDKWIDKRISNTYTVILFNVTNPAEVIKGMKPVVEEVGPYVFKQYRSKDVLSFDDEDMTVTYNDLKRYEFIEQQSADMSLKIYSLNLPLQGILMAIKKMSSLVRNLIIPGLDDLMDNYEETVFSHRTARELLFDGYKVDMIQDLEDFANAFVHSPKILPNNKFGFLYGKNNSGDGMFTVYTGFDDIAKYSQIVRWNNMSSIPVWGNEYCNMINGTDGSQFPPPIQKRNILHMFTPDLCRSVPLVYMKNVSVQGIPAYRFVTPEWLFESPQKHPDNMCYCTEPQFCELSGLLDMSSCRKGLKLAATRPHFYLADTFLTERIDGLKPDKEKHETYVDIEPQTGLVLEASRKLQMNFILDKFDEMKELKNLPMCVMPLLWITEEAKMDETKAALFTAKVPTTNKFAKSVLIACIVLGILWIVTAGVTFYILKKEQKNASVATESLYKVVPTRPDNRIKS